MDCRTSITNTPIKIAWERKANKIKTALKPSKKKNLFPFASVNYIVAMFV